MSFMDAREAGSKPGSGGAASQQNEVRAEEQQQQNNSKLKCGDVTAGLWLFEDAEQLFVHRLLIDESV